MNPALLALADHFFIFTHLFVTGFNLFGWMHRATRRIHRWFVAATLLCWLGVGLWVGKIGYCPLTDWHWDIKRARGETELPNSFITYLASAAGFYPDPYAVDVAVGVTFAAIVVITIVYWFIERQR